MEIKDIQGNILIDVPVTDSAVKTDELMKQHSITLSWSAVADDELPLGSYIEYDGIRYSLLAPYKPQQKDEVEYEYKPVFEHPVMRWQYLPFLFYTYSGDKLVSKEPDWSLTDNAANFMAVVCDAIKQMTGEDWTYEIADNLPASASLSFSNTDIFSALTSIASQFETEWWFDYANKVICLSKASYGNEVSLEVGQNISVPSVSKNREGYFTRFLVFGSTRNIEQDYKGSNTNSIVNRRLTLNPAKYPDGYIDIRQGLSNEEILSKTIVFDDIYPRSNLSISDVKVRLMWRLDSNDNKVQIGTDASGKPVYDQYAIWYFKIPALSFSKDMVISGKVLSVHFNDGPLQGREFELTYHDESKDVETSDGTKIKVEAGDYEINFIEDGTYIIPAITGLIPMDGNKVTLFNITMPEEYKASAYEELEKAALKEIAKQSEDMSNYSFSSNPVEFFTSNPNLTVGRKVTYKNGDYSYSTRIIKLETQLDRPYEQKITIGNEQIKGSTQTLKEEVVNANQNIDLIAAINESTQQLIQSYQRTQKALQESMSKWGNMWRFDADNNAVYTPLNLIVEGTIGMGGLGEGGSGEVATPNITIKFYGSEIPYTPDANGIITLPAYPEGGGGSGEGGITQVTAQMIEEALGYVPYSSKNPSGYITSAALNGYAKLTDIPSLAGYATEQWVKQQGYLTQHQDLSAYAKSVDVANTYATKVALQTLQNEHNALSAKVTSLDDLLNSDVSGVINTWGEVVDFLDEYSGSEDLATILAGMNNDITAVSNRVQKFEDVIGIDSNGDVYIKGTRNFYTAGGTIGMAGLGSGGSGGGAAGIVTVRVNGYDYNSVNGIVTLPDYPTSLPASDVYAWAKAATKPTYTASEVGALSTSGGTVTGDLTINTTLFVKNYLKIVAWPGYGEGATDMWYNGNTATVHSSAIHIDLRGNSVLHTGNYSSYALPLSGGTIEGVFGALSIKRNNAYASAIRLENTSGVLGYIGFNDDYTARLWDRNLNGIGIIIHSGNIGSQSVDNATKLGGYDSSRYAFINDIDSSYTHPDNIPLPYGDKQGFQGWHLPGYEYCGIIQWRDFNGNWSQIRQRYGANLYYRGTGSIPWREFAFTDSNVASADYATSAGNAATATNIMINYLYNQDSYFPILMTSADVIGTAVNSYVATDFNGQLLYNPKKNILKAGTFDGNATTATKLQTARTIWGQSFDGTGNIGDNGTGQWIFLNNKGDGIYIHTNGISFHDSSNGWIASNISCLSDGGVRLAEGSGNVLIGTTSDNGAKMRVYGSIWADEAITSTSAIRTLFYGTATCGLYPNTWISSDGVNNRLWLYNDNQLALYGSEIQLRNTTKVHGDFTVYRPGSTENLLIYVRDTQVAYQGYDSDGYIYHDFFSNDTHIARFDGYSNCLTVYNFINTQTIYTTNWVRSYNDTGWFNETYGGGIWMCDSDYVRVYNGKSFWCDGVIETSNQLVVNVSRDAVGPTNQAIVINSATGATSRAGWPGIGFHIPGITYATIKFGSDEHFYFFNYALSYLMPIKCGGMVAEGNITATGDIISEGTIAMARLASSSDRSLKNNIAEVSAEQSMSIVRQLRPTTWNWKKDGKKSYGFIAQEVEPIVPEMVVNMEHLHLEYNQLHAFEIGAIKHIDSEVEILKRRVNELENELKQYRRNAQWQ